MASGRAAGLVNVSPWPIASVNCFWAVTDALSVSVTVKLKLPEADGVPVIAPVGPSRVKPGGSEPAVTDHEYGGVPPVPASVTA